MFFYFCGKLLTSIQVATSARVSPSGSFRHAAVLLFFLPVGNPFSAAPNTDIGDGILIFRTRRHLHTSNQINDFVFTEQFLGNYTIAGQIFEC